MRATGGADTTWLRAALLLLLLSAAVVLALTLELPDVDVVRDRLRDAGPAGWAALVGGVGLVLMAPVPRTAVSVLLGVVAGFLPGLLVALPGALPPTLWWRWGDAPMLGLMAAALAVLAFGRRRKTLT